MAGGGEDTSILDSSYTEVERKISHDRDRERRVLLSDAWHLDLEAGSVHIMRVFIGQ